MEQAARHLAQDYWDIRERFVFGMETGSIAECVSRAIASPTHPVVLAESGDNPTGGGVGDRAEVLAKLIAQGATGTIFAGITDRAATDAAYAAGVGRRLRLHIGASLDPSSTPVDADAEVVFLHETGEPRLREAVVRIGDIDLVLTARRRPFHNIIDFTRLGLDPHGARIVVVKSGYLSPELGPIANPGIMALSPGVVDQFVERTERNHTPRPSYPFDRDFAFEPKVKWSKRAG